MRWAPLLVLPVIVCVENAQATTLAQVHERGFLVAGVVTEASPFGGAVDGKATGFDAALIDGLHKATALEIRQQPVAPGDLEAALSSGKIDLVASSVEITAPEKGSTIVYSSPVAEATRYYLKRKGDSRIKTVADLGDKKFGMKAGSSGLPELTEFEHRLAKAGNAALGEPVEYDNYKDAAQALRDKQIDFVIGDIADLQSAAHNDPDAFEIGDAVSQKIYVAWAAAKNSPEIVSLVSGYFSEQRKSGGLQALQQQFLGRPFPDLPETVSAKDWWIARDKPKVFPIPSIKDPD
jgi:polar amino acid transport system substrate-binding protein